MPSHFSILQITIYATEKTSFYSLSSHYAVKTLITVVPLAQVTLENFENNACEGED